MVEIDEETIQLLKQYYQIEIKLKEKGLIDSNKIISNLSEAYCREILKLKINLKSNKKGYDAFDKIGKKYEIKARRNPEWGIFRNKYSTFKKPLEFDYAILINFNPDYSLLSLIIVPKEIIDDELCKNGEFNLKQSNLKDKRIIKQVDIGNIEDMKWEA